MIRKYRTIFIIAISAIFSMIIFSCGDDNNNKTSDSGVEFSSGRDSGASAKTESGIVSVLDGGTSVKSEDGSSSRPNDGGEGDSAKSNDGGMSTFDSSWPVIPKGKYPSALNDAALPMPEGGASSGIVGVWYAAPDSSAVGEYCVVFCENRRFFYDDNSCWVESADYSRYFEYKYSDGVVKTYSKGGFVVDTLEIDLQSDHMVITKKKGGEPIIVAMDRVGYDSPLCTSDKVSLSD